jgi:arsenite methyltransferase
MTNNEQIRSHVADSYAKAVTRGTSCCGGGERDTRGVIVQWAGYTDSDTQNLPQDAVVSSFGCGNPLAFSEVQPGQTVLDLGSGAGIDLFIAAEKVGSAGHVIGVDMTDEMIAAAEKNIAQSGHKNVEVRKGLIEAMPVEDNSVDWVISNCVINLSPEKDKVFAEIFRVLKPGGQMRVSDIVVESLPEWVRNDSRLYDTCVGGAVSLEEYEAGLKLAGLADVREADTLTYDVSQIAALIESEVDGEAVGCCGGSGGVLTEVMKQASTELQGKIRSSVIVATKPA